MKRRLQNGYLVTKRGTKHYDVIVVGAGPAGIFATLELLKEGPDLDILVIDKGPDIDDRICPMKIKEISCLQCKKCSLLSGWGGAGAFSDGKLNLSSEIGGFLSSFLPKEELERLIEYVDSIYLKYGAPEEVYGGNPEEIQEITRLATKNDLIFIPSRIRHIGTDRCRDLLRNIRMDLKSKIDTLFEKRVETLLLKGRRIEGVRLHDGEEYRARYVIVAPGREGSHWLAEEAKRLGLTMLKNQVDIGVRVEVPASVLKHLTDVTYEPKFIFYSKRFDDRVRTFCVNPYGEVVKEFLPTHVNADNPAGEFASGIWTVNGHSFKNKKTDNTNFALLVSTHFTEPFNEPILYGKYIARLANFLGQGVLVQRLGDLLSGRRSTPERIKRGVVEPTLKDAVAGDLSFVIPYRYLSDILEMLEALDRIAPGVNSRHTLLYGVEVKFYSMQLKLSSGLETEVENLFAVGDGAGVSRGLIQASASGVIAAREILKKIRTY